MRDIDKNLSLRGEKYLHDYLWITRWLRTCMELSEITRWDICARIQFLNDFILRYRFKQDQSTQQLIVMRADSAADKTTIEGHRRQGLRMEKRHNMIVWLVHAMNLIDQFSGLTKIRTSVEELRLRMVYLLSVTSVAEGQAEGLDSKDVDVKAVPFPSFE
ncbi:hypothetical protein GN958_ATG09093 [Phytophthora infestans]|uniref:Uncharacterized protein n=1 Tax=Phytophthora infestans TaxID=4787 RepID=A0A8S9URN7_PHYIN|nr:hypothetical protein GN958_ATG09093 [Phytophthora infestans]